MCQPYTRTSAGVHQDTGARHFKTVCAPRKKMMRNKNKFHEHENKK